ncbi:hypothetical protein [uncultured Ilyobacter sp.]|nr:hypothetical protein [uncultured Ilyobacter sp.]
MDYDYSSERDDRHKMGSIYLPDISTQKRNRFFSYVIIEVEKD